MTFSFHPEADAEFFNAINHYEECEGGLGYDFSIEVYSAIQNILEYPEAWPILDDEIRRCQTNRFPYGILYSIEENEIFILAVMHLNRKPDYWKHRY
ncbi:MAG: type II toxin-antitoxin system RelE/ParE family toxin [Candidatus Sabulitectum sp.]|nr:type II toxin-antitoxin system RelE/ParE family toxin [Candidatus Sabulitectum sp.]